ncbi:MAG: hypothetical protein H6667_26250 [Ardenticatenaceae bacterium]|nr:hypothetical protein [Ardenticatenaceae bacterium]MCB9444292.1 hypothetical protein [Ardenticatenaceae bacterium]
MLRFRPKLEEGWSTWFLLWAMIVVSTIAIIQADLIDGLHILPATATLAVLAGTLLAKSRFSSNTSHFFSFIYGLFVIAYLIGTILPESMLWRERVFDIVNRQVVWMGKLVDGGTSRDRLIFVIHTSAIYWLLGYTAAWYTFRKPRVWRAVIPTGVVLLSVVYYYTGPRPLALYLAVYVVLALMFIARTHLVDEEKVWRVTAVRYERAIWFTFLRAGFLVSLIALVVAWSLPTLSASAAVGEALGGAQGPWREFQDNWTRLFSALRSYGTETNDPYQESLILGGPRTVGSTPIMDIYVPRELPNVYWQAVVWDRYEDDRWWPAENKSVLHYPDDGFLDIPQTVGREVITQTVVTYLPNSSLIYAAPEVIGSNKQMFVEANPDENGHMSITALRSRFVLRQGDRYKVASRISNADAQSLRTASTNYPDWIEETYLQLPDTITQETLDLAETLTAEHNNPFDKAIAVRDWLRTNISYNDQIPAPPEDAEPVDHILFVTKEGYCNYYASAMAVMLRSQGVPTRVVSGYAQGEFDEETLSYRVRASNAHTWVEVYFPAYGWIQFEPTAALPVDVRPETAGGGGDAFDSGPDLGPDFERGLNNGPQSDQDRLEELLGEDNALAEGGALTQNSFPVWQVVGAVLVVLVAGGTLVAANEMNRRVEADVDRSYGRLGSWARWLGLLFRPTQTPYERADLMTTAVPEGKAPIRNLTRQFVLKQFSPARAVEDGFDSQKEWHELRPLLIKRIAVNRIKQWQARLSREKTGKSKWRRRR